MIEEGDAAPDFTAPLATGEIEEFTLSARLDEAPLVLAFFPAAFSGTCTNEMTAFQERLDALRADGASLYGVSTDSPFALNEFREKHGLAFDLVSDYDREVVDAYGVRTDFESMGLHGLARRSVFVIDGDGRVTYRWTSEDPTVEPDYDAVAAAVARA